MIWRLRNMIADKDIAELIKWWGISFVITFFSFVFGYLNYWIIWRWFGAEGLWLFWLTTSIIGFFWVVASLWYGRSIIRYAGELKSKNNFWWIKKLYLGMIQIVFVLSVFISIGIYVFRTQIALQIFDEPLLVSILWVVAICFPLIVIKNINKWLLRSLKKIKLSEWLQKLGTSWSLTLVLIASVLWFSTSSIELPSYTILIANLIFAIVWSVICWRYISSYTSDTAPDMSLVTQISLPLMVAALSDLVLWQADIMMIGMFQDTADVGMYALASKMANGVSVMIWVSLGMLMPQISEAYRSWDQQKTKKILHTAVSIIFGFAVCAATILLLFPTFFLELFGDFGIARDALILLVINQVFNAWCGTNGTYMSLTGKQNYLKNIVIWSAVVNIVLNYFLIPLRGIEWAATSTLIAKVIANIIVVRYVYKLDNIWTCWMPFGASK